MLYDLLFPFKTLQTFLIRCIDSRLNPTKEHCKNNVHVLDYIRIQHCFSSLVISLILRSAHYILFHLNTTYFNHICIATNFHCNMVYDNISAYFQNLPFFFFRVKMIALLVFIHSCCVIDLYPFKNNILSNKSCAKECIEYSLCCFLK